MTDAHFRDEAIVCLRNVQSAWLDLLSESGLRNARPTDVSRRLGMTSSMAWKLSKFAHTTDVHLASRHLPGAGGVEILLNAAHSRGAPKRCIEAVRKADQALREYVHEHAGSRRTFEAMLAGAVRDEQSEFEERRSIFRACSIVWGVRARVQMGTLLIKPSDSDPAMIDTVTLTGLFEFERLRADVPWIIRRSLQVDAQTEQPCIRRSLVTRTSKEHSLSLIPKYCTDPLPGIRELAGPDGMVYTEIVSTPVGRAGAATCVMGEMFLNCHQGDSDTEGLLANMELHTPVEYAVNDVFLHEDLAQYDVPRVMLFNRAENRPNEGDLDELQVPLYPPTAAGELGMHRIGASQSGVSNPRIDRYDEMLVDAIQLAGWDHRARYRGFRAELEYPPVPCRLTLDSDIKLQ